MANAARAACSSSGDKRLPLGFMEGEMSGFKARGDDDDDGLFPGN